MIKASELRIGNWVIYPGYDERGGNFYPDPDGDIYHKIQAEDIYRIETHKGIIGTFKPIPLTHELLEKCGFEKATSEDVQERTIYGIQVANNTSLYLDPHKDWMRNDYEVEWYLSHEWNNNHFKNDFWAKPKHLHQLQNLFFALTGEELQVNL